MRATPISVSHPNQHLNGLAITISIVASVAGVILVFHQIQSFARQAAVHQKEKKLLDLQIAKHEQDLAKEVTPPLVRHDQYQKTANWAN